MVAHAFNPGCWEEKASESLSLRLAWSKKNEFQDSQSLTDKPCLRGRGEGEELNK